MELESPPRAHTVQTVCTVQYRIRRHVRTTHRTPFCKTCVPMNLSPQDSACWTMNLSTIKSTTREQIMCIRIHILILFTFLGCIAHHTVAFAHRPSSVRPTMTIMSQYVEEKKDDGILYWEPSFNGFEPLPSLKTRPKMIVFDKDGTNESWWEKRFPVVVVITCTTQFIVIFGQELWAPTGSL
jgi:hypothetical protein